MPRTQVRGCGKWRCALVSQLVWNAGSRGPNRFERLCPELGLFRAPAIFRARVSQNCLTLTHESAGRRGGPSATCFVPAAYGRRAFVSRGRARGLHVPGTSSTRTRPRRPCAAHAGVVLRSGPCALPGGRGGAVRIGEVVSEGPCAPTAATSAHTPFETRPPVRMAGDNEWPSAHTPAKTGPSVRTAGSCGNDASVHRSQAARAHLDCVPSGNQCRPTTSLMVPPLQAQNS